MFYQAQGFQIPIFPFADDTIMFTRLTKRCLKGIRQFHDGYHEMSRKKVNASKSLSILPSQHSPAHKWWISSLLGFKIENPLLCNLELQW